MKLIIPSVEDISNDFRNDTKEQEEVLFNSQAVQCDLSRVDYDLESAENFLSLSGDLMDFFLRSGQLIIKELEKLTQVESNKKISKIVLEDNKIVTKNIICSISKNKISTFSCSCLSINCNNTILWCVFIGITE